MIDSEIHHQSVAQRPDHNWSEPQPSNVDDKQEERGRHDAHGAVDRQSIIFCAIIFDVANPPFSRVSEGRFQMVFLYGQAIVGYYNSNTNSGAM
jgi:hypothetical protein